VKEYSSFKRYNKGNTKKIKIFYRQKKNPYTNEDNISSDGSGGETKEIISMGVQTQTDGNVHLTKEEDSEIYV
jgi:hypothetical protein